MPAKPSTWPQETINILFPSALRKFKYLGSLGTQDNDLEVEVKRRISITSVTLDFTRNSLLVFYPDRPSFICIRLIIAVLLYRLELWTIS